MLLAIGVLALWFVLGFVINIAIGGLSMYTMKKYFNKYDDPMKEMDRFVTIQNMQEGHYETPSNIDLAINALLWPRTLYYAYLGQKKLINILKEQQNTR